MHPPSQGKMPVEWLKQYEPSVPPDNMFLAFALADKERKGYLTKEQLAIALKNAGEDFEKNTVDALMQMFDLDQNNRLDFQEFKELWGYVQKMKQAFQESDVERTGELDKNQSEKALLKGMPFLSFIPGRDTILKNIMSFFDRSGKGRFKFTTFLMIAAFIGLLYGLYHYYRKTHPHGDHKLAPKQDQDIGDYFNNMMNSEDLPYHPEKVAKDKKEKKDKKQKKDKKAKKEKKDKKSKQ